MLRTIVSRGADIRFLLDKHAEQSSHPSTELQRPMLLACLEHWASGWVSDLAKVQTAENGRKPTSGIGTPNL